jgi:hypothetical protein
LPARSWAFLSRIFSRKDFTSSRSSQSLTFFLMDWIIIMTASLAPPWRWPEREAMPAQMAM